MINYLLASVPVAINDKAMSVDFSLIDTGIGLAAGIVATALVFIAVGYFLKKFEIITFSQAKVTVRSEEYKHPECENCLDHRAEHERSLTNQTNISTLYTKVNDLRDKLNLVVTDVAVIKEGNSMILGLLRTKK